MTSHSSILAWKVHGQRILVGQSPWACKRVRHNLVTKQQQNKYIVQIGPFLETCLVFRVLTTILRNYHQRQLNLKLWLTFYASACCFSVTVCASSLGAHIVATQLLVLQGVRRNVIQWSDKRVGKQNSLCIFEGTFTVEDKLNSRQDQIIFEQTLGDSEGQGSPGVLQFMGSNRAGHDLVTEQQQQFLRSLLLMRFMILYFLYLLPFYLFILVTLHSLQDLSSLTRD